MAAPAGGAGGGRRGGAGGAGSAGSDSDGGEPPAKRAKTAVPRRELEARQLQNRRSTRAEADGSATPAVRSAGGRRSTATSRAAVAAGRSQRVGEATAALAAAAADTPGSYAAAALSNQGFNREQARRASGTAKRADHIPTDFSQRGPAVPRESATNREDTIRRPAFSVPAARHDAHPTTVFGHEEGGVAARERRMQLTGGSSEVESGARAATAADYERGRMSASELHLRHYGRQAGFVRTGERERQRMRDSLAASLAAPTRLRDDRGRDVAHVSLSKRNQQRVLGTFDRAAAGDFSGYHSDPDTDVTPDAPRARGKPGAARAAAAAAAAPAAPTAAGGRHGSRRVATAAAAASADDLSAGGRRSSRASTALAAGGGGGGGGGAPAAPAAAAAVPAPRGAKRKRDDR